ncbi:hypothetical protein VHEMI02005 [[Torrubiella] hemipterigena]|uniref:Enoyl reductase (ER) domain-containing protein n=1 Tax=[Torrubiella] hemipterigena TaxID=1531966 RepID=A0A0A1SUJ6_9HYPO|nr:hypothetical protein VHEMI02005 [[Torrubiella] hemipterigena]
MAQVLRSQAAVLVAPNQNLAIQERDVPSAGKGCVNIQVVRAGVCGTDPHLWRGDLPVPEPVVLGHEGVGKILELGEGVTKDHAGQDIAVGDAVYWNPIRPCNACYDCTISQDMTACENGTFWSPASNPQVWASYTQIATLLPNNSFYKIDDTVPLDAYIALGCALPTMLQAEHNLGGIKTGSKVVVQGAGPVGLAAIMLSKLAGAETIICIEANAARLDRARDFGAKHLINMTEPDLSTSTSRRSKIWEWIQTRGADLVIECSGNAAAFEEGVELLGRSGQYLVVGTWAGSTKVNISPFDIVRKALKITGSTYCSPWCYYKAAKLVAAHHTQFPLTRTVTHRYALQDAQHALEDVAQGKVGKAVIYPQGLQDE